MHLVAGPWTTPGGALSDPLSSKGRMEGVMAVDLALRTRGLALLRSPVI